MNKLTLICIQMFVLTGILGRIIKPLCLPDSHHVSISINSIKNKLTNNKSNQYF